MGNSKSWTGQIKEIRQMTIRNFMELIKNTKGRRKQNRQQGSEG